GLALAAIPGALLASPLVAARFGSNARHGGRPAVAARVEGGARPHVRTRVAVQDDDEADASEAGEPSRMAATVD
ncbi:MAG: hypothetical protein ACRELB_03480, partial [Polyangiaceae bacterium]